MIEKALANGHQEVTTVAFPQWTYWGEIMEHTILLLLALITTFLLIFVWQKKKEPGLKLQIFGWGLVSLSQILVNLQHLTVYPVGIYTALAHHGLLVLGLILIAGATLKTIIKFTF